MAISEYPGKTGHYRMCLEIIANAVGEERPALANFLNTGAKRKPFRTSYRHHNTP